VAVLAAVALQLIPLPAAFRDALSPHARAVEQALRFGVDAARPHPLTIDPASTAGALAVSVIVAAAFWITRSIARHDALRRLARAIAWAGLALSVLAIVLRATTATGLVYGIWYAGESARPYGPFINRNHTGTWLLLALPLVVGYMLARTDRQARRGRPAFDTAMLWLGASAAAILAAALGSLSRSTAVGLAAAAVFGTSVALRRGGRPGRWLFAAAIVSAMVALSLRQTVELADRFENSRATATWDRPEIWRETAAIVRDFPATGVGAGAFEGAMLVYQRADRRIFFNQAHDQYMQFAAEGGVLLLVPLAWLAIVFTRDASLRLAHDASALFWIRLGALAAIAGVVVQSVWETGLRMPANAMLFAVIAALAVADDR
jgi:hypothetical protein